ncbi:chemotaxis protein CheC [Clostridioides sp. ES-S-0190-01]|nr:chemotaxis protein CheC [Clostridioides sp. ES-S-0049-03]MCC0654598.1 chemotaxis protein CheC [Clostridioides sp. ES-S-0001-03]MCC0675815.1 chemotaxis protein CheC [Clostridioides sp. ES-W-0018-02]MCC0681151.1 chemotaxis protein CheC [Clostridioides sp. ES-S-0005-03]MCC0696963.1 chemotaxis protein CheC [Clostridioides sp. ES-S-0048-02]MCC0706047.1 chemotaxis protein CheC [Clostridioides sp. ES-S-0190-01]MCC0711105.1 chemotaxis protein CheC [Clostridioides sp. ES-W-0017-02]UDN49336.1 chemo
MINYSQLDNIHIDALREIGNIGSGNAITALASMINSKIEVLIPMVKILKYNEATNLLGGPENKVVCILLDMKGDINGMFMFLLDESITKLMLNSLFNKDEAFLDEITGIEISAIKEIGNIMASSYVNAIASMLNMNISISVPDMCIDMVGAVLNVPMIRFSDVGDKILFIENKFKNSDNYFISHILMIPEMDSLKDILVRLGLSV